MTSAWNENGSHTLKCVSFQMQKDLSVRHLPCGSLFICSMAGKCIASTLNLGKHTDVGPLQLGNYISYGPLYCTIHIQCACGL